MEFVLLYLFISIEKIAAFLAIGGALFKWSFIAYLFTYVLGFAMSKDKEDLQTWNVKLKKHRTLAVASVMLGGLLFTTSSLLPTKKELAIIVGGGMVYQVLSSPEAKSIGNKSVQLLQQKIEEALNNEIKPVKE